MIMSLLLGLRNNNYEKEKKDNDISVLKFKNNNTFYID